MLALLSVLLAWMTMRLLRGQSSESGCASGRSPTRPGGGRGERLVEGVDEAYARAARTAHVGHMPDCARDRMSPAQRTAWESLESRCQHSDIVASALAVCDGYGDRHVSTETDGRKLTAAQILGTRSPSDILSAHSPHLGHYADEWEEYVTSGECLRRGR